jgi:hypothetical protein
LQTEKPNIVGIGGGAIDLEIFIPDTVSVARIFTTDGDVSLQNVSGSPVIETDDGDLSVYDISGGVTLETDDGNISVNDVDGTVVAWTDDGDISIRNPGQIKDIQTDDGNVTVEVPKTSDQASVTSNDGDITVQLAESLNATLDARTDDGDINVTDGIGKVKSVTDTNVEISVGGGKNDLSVETDDGDITIN